MNAREEFLIKMYEQLCQEIRLHFTVLWQCISVLVGAFAIFALVEKKVISLDVAAGLIILLGCWLLAHLLDTSYWYNRNLVIIANIERQFLDSNDLKLIHYYFGKHRKNNAMITLLRIQTSLGFVLGLIIVVIHFNERVLPGIGSSWDNFEVMRAVPYIILLSAVVYLGNLRRYCNKKYQEFISNSPGADVDTSSISYGVGHGYKKK